MPNTLNQPIRKIEFLSITVIALLAVTRLVTLDPGHEKGHDTFYHITMADLGPSYCMSRTLPSMTLSVWYEHFSDKELSFHLLLSGIREIMSLSGQPLGAPFHLEYLFFITLLIGSFFITANYFKIKNIYLYLMAMMIISPFFTNRVMLLRPHLLSISIMLICCPLFDLTNSWRRIWVPLLIGYIMAWSYSNPHFILLPATAFALVKFKNNWKLASAIPMIAILGVALGLTLHPQFPNTFLNWKIQCIDVVMVSFDHTFPVKLGKELRPASFVFFIDNIYFIFVALVNVGLFICYMKSSRFLNADKSVIAMFLIFVISSLGVFFAVRAVEYAVPFTLLATGMLIARLNITLESTTKESTCKRRRFSFLGYLNCSFLFLKKKDLVLGLTICLIIFLLYEFKVQALNNNKKNQVKPFKDLGEYLINSGLPTGSVIGNINWSDFPLLFYVAPRYRYLTGIDPMFTYVKDPDRMSKIELFRTGFRFMPPKELFDATKTRYIFVSHYNHALAVDMFKEGYISIYQGNDGDLFDLKLSQENRKKHH